MNQQHVADHGCPAGCLHFSDNKPRAYQIRQREEIFRCNVCMPGFFVFAEYDKRKKTGEHRTGNAKPGSLKFIEHGNSVKQMPGIDHQCQQKRMKGCKGGQQQIGCHKFHRACEDARAHATGINQGKALAAHHKSI